jgi:hypothetical protein
VALIAKREENLKCWVNGFIAVILTRRSLYGMKNTIMRITTLLSKESGVMDMKKSMRQRRTNKNGNFGHTFSFVLGLRL